jgi:hypothetical protein
VDDDLYELHGRRWIAGGTEYEARGFVSRGRDGWTWWARGKMGDTKHPAHAMREVERALGMEVPRE